MRAYHIAPIDFGWESLKTVAGTVRKLSALKVEFAINDINEAAKVQDADRFLADWEAAKQMAREKGWDGDFRQDPVVFWIPFNDGFRYGFVFKQNTKGTTFVITPVAMPWLTEV